MENGEFQALLLALGFSILNSQFSILNSDPADASSGDPRAEKAHRRQWARAQRDAMPEAERRARSEQIFRRVRLLPEFAAARGVLCYVAFGSEPYSGEFIEETSRERKVYVPRADWASGSLTCHSFPVDLISTRFGLPQPPPEAPALDESAVEKEIDLAILPGLLFDLEGYRLGYGAGFFDRFLARHPIDAVAAAYDWQVGPHLPRTDSDRPVSTIVTDQRVIRCEMGSEEESRRHKARNPKSRI